MNACCPFPQVVMSLARFPRCFVPSLFPSLTPAVSQRGPLNRRQSPLLCLPPQTSYHLTSVGFSLKPDHGLKNVTPAVNKDATNASTESSTTQEKSGRQSEGIDFTTTEGSDTSRKERPADPKIGAASTLEALLSLVAEQRNDVYQCSLILSKIRSIVRSEEQRRDVLADPRFNHLIESIDSQTSKLSMNNVFSCMTCLRSLGVNVNAHVILALQHDLLWRIRRCSFPFVLMILQHQCSRMKTADEKSSMDDTLLKEAANNIQRRWIEITSLKEVLSLLHHHDMFGVEFLERVEDRAVEVTSEATAALLSKTIIALANAGRRPAPLLRSLTYYLNKSNLRELTLRQLADLLSALYRIHFPDQLLLDGIAQELSGDRVQPHVVPGAADIPKAPGMVDSSVESTSKGMSRSILRSVITTLGLLKWRKTDVVDSLVSWLQVHADETSGQEWISVLLTCAAIDYYPPQIEALLQTHLFPVLDWSQLTNYMRVELTWALAALDKCNDELLLASLEPSVVSSIQGPGPRSKLLTLYQLAKTRELELRGVLEVLLPQLSDTAPFNPPLLVVGSEGATASTSTSPVPEPPTTPKKAVIASASPRSQRSILSKNVRDALATFVSRKNCLRENVTTPLGVPVDAEFFVDHEAKPVPLATAGQVTDKKRVAVVVQDFKELCLHSIHPHGATVLNVRLLRAMGYTVLAVPHLEFGIKDKPIVKVQYLSRKLKEVCG
ncbi:unnamed protein product [Cyprideis torosa]|uniref:Uncharacterized protein n=1 Tax=Cyprideis torosa TaxID=163714 RepID=A0A7R8WEG9_9CRUS|nr:unnamed protein product [Cyprideis torosa]CAG0895724.1 unnamed protein product [Cyprideis torosa]